MDILLGRVTQQAMNYAIRSGITITATYAIKQCGRLLKEAPRSKDREELMQLQLRLDSKIRIISPAIDMIELISARGNTSLETAATLTRDIRYEIQRLGVRLSNAANDEEMLKRKSSRAKSREETERELKAIIYQIKNLLTRIEDAIPLINLAITTSGVNLSTQLSGTISPSRLLQASTFLTAADSKYAADPGIRQQVGPTYTLSLYMLFASHAWRPVDEAGVRETTWKEVIHKAHVKLIRVPHEQLNTLPGDQPTRNSSAGDFLHADAKASEFAYQLLLIEDLDDDRVHAFEDNVPQPGPFDDVPNAGIRDIIPVHQISKIFYADTGKILNIGGGDGENDIHNPVLLLKRDPAAEPPRRLLRRSQMEREYSYFDSPASVNGAARGSVDVDVDDTQSEVDAQFERESRAGTPSWEASQQAGANQSWRLPADLDPEWMAFEVYAEDSDSENDDDNEAIPTGRTHNHHPSSRQTAVGPELVGALSKLQLRSSTSTSASSPTTKNGVLIPSLHPTASVQPTLPIKTTLSLLEMLLKLTAVQQFRQTSHLTIEDELLNFFLRENATAGTTGFNKDRRQRIRRDAMRRVGFDPYDESPVKQSRGVGYVQQRAGGGGQAFDSLPHPQQEQLLPYEEAYGYDHDDYQDDLQYPEQYPEHRQGQAQTQAPIAHHNHEYEHPYDRDHQEQGHDHPPPASSPLDRPRFCRDPLSPRPLLLQQTPSRTSTPGSSTGNNSSSERHRLTVRAKYGGGGGRGVSSSLTGTQGGSGGSGGSGGYGGGAMQTPPSTVRSREALLRTNSSEVKVRSPLGREVRDMTRQRVGRGVREHDVEGREAEAGGGSRVVRE
ncbi:hypothetical protein BAUCODRAFT_29940 [Baudoinia panamericana UAMH 10762]|uniref:Ran-binding-domain-containing protein n=1 Tax=Baudoinia panamericana (strain UAMH 10762) TaxID=717646 RepID=M2LXZ9_BAUPA|nr:uncharacterized protein BAUCODRAFT_29940 [Baudoinia panamericana UAMH 10762]EMC99567.1 hypothetical protein BAUCODRAFT_29940 [Baudoinia panamericana UAMH 10762]